MRQYIKILAGIFACVACYPAIQAQQRGEYRGNRTIAGSSLLAGTAWFPPEANDPTWPVSTNTSESPNSSAVSVPVTGYVAAPVALSAARCVYSSGTFRTPVRRILSAPLRWRRARCGIPCRSGVTSRVFSTQCPTVQYYTDVPVGGLIIPESIAKVSEDISSVINGDKQIITQVVPVTPVVPRVSVVPRLKCYNGVCRPAW